MKALDVLQDAWSNRAALGDGAQQRELAAFLPAALEIQESPPNPLTRWMAWSLVTLFTLGVIWASFGKVDIVASAEGKIIPSSRVKLIQPIQKAVVQKILVTEGQAVRKGQPLVELDSTLTGADKNRLSGELRNLQLQLAVYTALNKTLAQRPTKNNAAPVLQLDSLAAATAHDRTLHEQLLQEQWLNYQARRDALQHSLTKTRAEQAAVREEVGKLEQTLPLTSKRAESMHALVKDQLAPEDDYLQLEQTRIEQQQDLAAARQRIAQLDAATKEIAAQISSLTSETQAETLGKIAELQQQTDSAREELAKATDINARQILYAPVSGMVQQLAISTVGGVVTDAQQLMLIVPDEDQLEVEVMIENQDIGFVEEGMPAEIKVHTFPFTKYGVIDAKVTSVSDDAIVDEKRGLIYSMRLLMEKNTIQIENKNVKLMPGMAVTAEVKTGKRRIIEYFMAPLLKYKQESIRER